MNREPLLTVASLTSLATAVLFALVAFGVDLTDDQQAAILGIVGVLAPIVAGLLARPKVTPAVNSERHVRRQSGTVSGDMVLSVALGVVVGGVVLWVLELLVNRA